MKFLTKKETSIRLIEKIKLEISGNSFEKFISIHITSDLPSSLVEHFAEINILTSQTGLDPQIIFSDTEYICTTHFQILVRP